MERFLKFEQTLALQIMFLGLSLGDMLRILADARLYERTTDQHSLAGRDILAIFGSASTGVPLSMERQAEITTRLAKDGIFFGRMAKESDGAFLGYSFLRGAEKGGILFGCEIVKDEMTGEIYRLPQIQSGGIMLRIRFGVSGIAVPVAWSDAFALLEKLKVVIGGKESLRMKEEGGGICTFSCRAGDGGIVFVGQKQSVQ